MGFWGIPIVLEKRATNPVDTDVSTVETIQQMISLARVSTSHPLISSVVDSCLRRLRNNSPTKKDIAREIWWWVKNHIRFETDEAILARELGYENDPNQELLIGPDALLQMPIPTGDCDDFAMLVAAMLLCAHIPCKYCAIAVDGDQPWRFSHVYCIAILDDGEMVMDVSHGGVPGWETKRHMFRRMEWLVS
jgi:transglutaminase-like putative cysteine protease